MRLRHVVVAAAFGLVAALGWARANQLLMPYTPAGGGGGAPVYNGNLQLTVISAPTGTCSQSTAYFAAVWGQGITLDGTVNGTPGAANHQQAYDQLICKLVSDNNTWGTLDRLYVFATADATSDATKSRTLALIDLVSGQVATLHGTPTFTPNTGMQGIAASPTTVWIDTGFNPTVGTPHFTQSLGALGLWSFGPDGVSPSGASGGIGLENSGGTQTSDITIWWNDGNTYLPVNANATVGQPVVSCTAVGCGLGSWVTDRTGSTTTGVYWKGVSQTQQGTGGSAPATALVNGNFYVLAINVNGTANGSGRMFGAASIGYGLDPTTQVSSLGATPVTSANASTGTGLVPRLCVFLTNIHGSC